MQGLYLHSDLDSMTQFGNLPLFDPGLGKLNEVTVHAVGNVEGAAVFRCAASAWTVADVNVGLLAEPGSVSGQYFFFGMQDVFSDFFSSPGAGSASYSLSFDCVDRVTWANRPLRSRD